MIRHDDAIVAAPAGPDEVWKRKLASLRPRRGMASQTALPSWLPALLLGLLALGTSLLLPVGFAGWDDLHYLEAARRWLSEGVNLPADHWATRLPYVLAMAGSLRVFGVSVLALTVLNAVLFAVLLILVWRIATVGFDRATALATLVVVVATPLFFRMPTTFYPEVMEVVFAAGATLLTLHALRDGGGNRRLVAWLGAGLAAGFGILVRQTALVMPIALVVLITLTERARDEPGWPMRVVGAVVPLGLGTTLPVAVETLFYLRLTGNPLERLRIDSRHVLIPSAHLRNGTFTGGSPLFNWTLASRWDVPGLVHVHWTIDPVLRLFVAPPLLLTPWLCLAGGLLAATRPGWPRRYAGFAATVFVAQYLLNTFVLVIAPDTRYFSIAIALAAPLAGLLLVQLGRTTRMLAAVALIAGCVVLMALAPSPAHLVPRLARFATQGEPLHVSPELMDAATIMRVNHPALDARLILSRRRDQIPVGALSTGEAYGWEANPGAGTCADGRPQWQQVDRLPAGDPGWTVWLRHGLGGRIMGRLMPVLSGERDQLSLLRRAC